MRSLNAIVLALAYIGGTHAIQLERASTRSGLAQVGKFSGDVWAEVEKKPSGLAEVERKLTTDREMEKKPRGLVEVLRER